ncbi:MAG TPA: GAF domain-containing protein [Pyrinomonadaceae bacterium]
MASQLPRANEAARLAVLHQFEVLDTDPEQTFDDITRLAAYICHTPIAIITLVDAHRQWFKSRVGLSLGETARDISFCAHAIRQPGPLVVRDALDDERFRDNPLVLADPYIRFYAGSPLVTIEGFSLGTLCVIDRYPREITPEQMAALRVLSQQVMTQLELRRTIKSLTRSLGEAKQKVHELEQRVPKEG